MAEASCVGFRQRRLASRPLRTAVLASLLGAAGLLCRYGSLPDSCFSKVSLKPAIPKVPGSGPASQSDDPTAVVASATAEAWLTAARRTAAGDKDSAAHWEAAWEGTDAYWLRPAAYIVASLVCFGAMLQKPRRFVWTAPRPAAPPAGGFLKGRKAEREKLALANDLEAAAALKALRRMELPFFATSAAWRESAPTG
ncbi:unnamed protein product, partial [Polarella glacialis]